MPRIKSGFEDIEAFLLDMDGVIYIGDTPIEGSKEAVQFLKEQGKEIVLLTNNSTKSRHSYKKKFSQIGLEIEESKIITSSYATALYLSENYGSGSVYVIGEEGLKEELKMAGFDVLSRERSSEAEFVVVGMDRGLSYDKIWGGLTAMLSGAEFIATNSDPTYPMEDGLAPGAGASIGALSGSVEEEPSVVIGKPSTYMIETSLELLGVSPEKTAIVGDRIEMDIRAGNRAGVTSVFVLSGVGTEEDVEKAKSSEDSPDYVLSKLSEIIK